MRLGLGSLGAAGLSRRGSEALWQADPNPRWLIF
jgi:hypothetical protein